MAVGSTIAHLNPFTAEPHDFPPVLTSLHIFHNFFSMLSASQMCTPIRIIIRIRIIRISIITNGLGTVPSLVEPHAPALVTHSATAVTWIADISFFIKGQ